MKIFFFYIDIKNRVSVNKLYLIDSSFRTIKTAQIVCNQIIYVIAIDSQRVTKFDVVEQAEE